MTHPDATHPDATHLDAAHPDAAHPDAARQRIAAQQAALTAALVAGAAAPPGFDERRLAVAVAALLNKRADEVANAWPALAAALGTGWRPLFRTFAAGRPPHGSLCDGFDFARQLAQAGRLPPAAVPELRAREAYWRYSGAAPPRPRRLPAPVQRWLGAWRVRRLIQPAG
jgi:hypothetical protein